MFHPTQARLKIVVGALSRSVARLQTICCLADSTLSASFCPGRAHSKKSDCPGALIIPPPTPSSPPPANTCRCDWSLVEVTYLCVCVLRRRHISPFHLFRKHGKHGFYSGIGLFARVGGWESKLESVSLSIFCTCPSGMLWIVEAA